MTPRPTKFRALVLALIYGVAALLACAQCATAAPYTTQTLQLLENPPSGVTLVETVEAALFSRLNQLRKAKGVPLLRPLTGLRDAARAHSLRMSRDAFFSHTDPDGYSAAARVAAVDRQNLYSTFGENLAEVAPIKPIVADQMQNGWVNSPGHYKNMVSTAFTHVGLGCVQNGRKTICAQVFAKLVGALVQPLAPVQQRSGGANLNARIGGLSYGGWILRDRAETERARGYGHMLRWPNGLKGDFLLRIIGADRNGNRIMQHHFFAPSVVLE